MSHRLAVPAGGARLLRGLVAELVALHDDPDDHHPSWQRLYPRTTADPRLDRDLRDLVHPDLVEGRREALEQVGEALADVADDAQSIELDDEQAVAVLGVVNDVRIAMAAAIDLPGLLATHDGELPESLPESTLAAAELVDWMGFLQEQVLASLAPESQSHFDDPVHGDSDLVPDDARDLVDLPDPADDPDDPADTPAADQPDADGGTAPDGSQDPE